MSHLPEKSSPVVIVARLAKAGATLALAESLTGGKLADALIDVPGASRVVRGAIVAYATDLKASMLGVDPELLARCGPVDPEVALQMAQGARVRLGAEFGVATTGVAGPAAQDGVPVGTVYLAVVGPQGPTIEKHRYDGGRDAVRRKSVEGALRMINELTLDLELSV